MDVKQHFNIDARPHTLSHSLKGESCCWMCGEVTPHHTSSLTRSLKNETLLQKMLLCLVIQTPVSGRQVMFQLGFSGHVGFSKLLRPLRGLIKTAYSPAPRWRKWPTAYSTPSRWRKWPFELSAPRSTWQRTLGVSPKLSWSSYRVFATGWNACNYPTALLHERS